MRRCAERTVSTTGHIPQQALTRICRVGQAVDRTAFRGGQPLNIDEEEGLVPPDRPSQAPAVDVLHELALAEIVEIIRPFIRVQPRRPIEPKGIAVKFIGARLCQEQNVGSAVAADVRRRITCNDAELAQRVRVRTRRREV
jgi:hypothetical protein